MLGSIATYDPSSVTRAGAEASEEEKAAIRESLLAASGAEPRVLLIRKCSILAMGKSVEEAWMAAYLATAACESQVSNSTPWGVLHRIQLAISDKTTLFHFSRLV